MSELPRLFLASQNPATRDLLKAGLDDRAPADTASVLIAGLGLGAATVAISSVGGAASAGVGLGAKAAAAPLSVLSIAKWLAIGACAGTLGSAGAELATGSWSNAATSAPSPSERGSLADTVAAREPGIEPARDVPRPETLAHDAKPEQHAPATGRKLGAPAAGGAGKREGQLAPPTDEMISAVPSARRESALDNETRLVDGARQALGQHDLRRALSLLDGYDQTKSVGVLDREALLLRVELAILQGNPERARALAARFERSYPGDAHIVRLRALLTRAETGAPR